MSAALKTHSLVTACPTSIVRQSSRFFGPSHKCKLISFHSRDRRKICSIQSSTAYADKGFHQRRLEATQKDPTDREDPLSVIIREAVTDDELQAAAALRAVSFYAYPPERAFAGKLHQAVKKAEEFELLCSCRERMSDWSEATSSERFACLVATCAQVPGDGIAEELVLDSNSERPEAVVGTLDLCAVRAMPGEVLIGNCSNAAYIANVCVSDAARRRGVGLALVQDVKKLARLWGVDGLYVHIMAINTAACKFYERAGFEVEKEESTNRASQRGHCIDGIEGRGRTILLRATSLED